MDPFAFLDGSATRITDPTWIYHLKDGAGHYFGNVADLYAGFDGPDGDGRINKEPTPTPPTQFKVTPSTGMSERPGGIDPNYSIAPGLNNAQKAMTQPWNYAILVTTVPTPQ